nr:TerB family tellurite resistance protein [Synechococcus sp. AH-551-E19]
MTKKTMSTLLEIAKLIALSDGNISKEEAQLIRDLPHQISVNTNTVEDDLVHQAEASTLSLKELVEALTSHEERCLAARVAYLVAAVSRQPRDRIKINVDEQRVIQELLQELSLSKDELEGIESSAMQELNQNRSPIRLVMDLIFGDEKLPDLLVEKLYYAEGRHHSSHPLHHSYEGLTSDLKR